MRWLKSVSLLLAVVFLIGYLITRPHLGTVYIAQVFTIDDKTSHWSWLTDLDEFPSKAQCDRLVEKREELELNAQIAHENLPYELQRARDLAERARIAIAAYNAARGMKTTPDELPPVPPAPTAEHVKPWHRSGLSCRSEVRLLWGW